LEAKYKKGPFKVKREHMMDWSDMAETGIRDMIDIDELNHSTILYNLFSNYKRDDIYTYVGPTLLAVNPFKNMDHKFPEEKCLKDYQAITEAEA
jgi:myosin heavy subunit